MPEKNGSQDAMSGINLRYEQLFKQVAQQIQDIIIGGGLKPGDKMPSERTLAENLNVSRTVIREALKLLEDRGLITINVGSGTYVSELQDQAVSKPISLYIQQQRTSIVHLLEVRQMIEIEMAGLAAKNATDADLSSLQESMLALEQSMGQPDEFVEADFRFHELLAKASQNPLLPLLLDPIREQMRQFFRLALSPAGSPLHAVQHHHNILNAVLARDVPGARQAMRTHLESAARLSAIANEQIDPTDDQEDDR